MSYFPHWWLFFCQEHLTLSCFWICVFLRSGKHNLFWVHYDSRKLLFLARLNCRLFYIIRKPRFCNRKINVSIANSISFWESAISKMSSRDRTSRIFRFLNKNLGSFISFVETLGKMLVILENLYIDIPKSWHSSNLVCP